MDASAALVQCFALGGSNSGPLGLKNVVENSAVPTGFELFSPLSQR